MEEKIIGAGGGGFFLMVSKNPNKAEKFLKKISLDIPNQNLILMVLKLFLNDLIVLKNESP